MGGTTDKAKGNLKQAAGDLTGDEELKNEGRLDEATGKVKDAVSDVKDKVEDVIDGVAGKLKKD
jgi:uncharacterized protein YjbJ (UPF0337 family)